jgi:hypothetical protein
VRLWSLHPKYLDARGLVALWREALLAQAVLRGRTVGYTRHPQLARFRRCRAPVACVARYLAVVHEESTRRGYRFDGRKIGRRSFGRGRLTVNAGQLEYEWRHLKAKLARRDRALLATLKRVARPVPHPLFRVLPGPIEAWEQVQR